MEEVIHVELEKINAYPPGMTYQDLIRTNKRNSLILIVLMVLVLIALGAGIGAIVGTVLQPNHSASYSGGYSGGSYSGGNGSGGAGGGIDFVHAIVVGGIAAAVVAFFGSLWSWFNGSGAILSITDAQPLDKSQDPQLYNVVDELRLAAGIPMPQIYLIDDPAMNAFATGRDPEHSSVAITTGLRSKLTRDELAGVLAHELSHIRHYDIRFTMLMATMVGLIVLVADVARQALWFAPSRGSRSRDESGGAAVLIAIVAVLLLSGIALVLAKVIQFAVSREREYLADAGAVELTRYPRGLASALSKLAVQDQPMLHANRAVAHLFIVNPFGGGEDWHNIDSVFRTHPPLEDRIARLLALER